MRILVTRVRTGAAVIVIAVAVLLVPAQPAVARGPQRGPVKIQTSSVSFAWCFASAFIQKVSATSTGSQANENCSGNTLVKRLSLYLDRCTFEFPPGNCLTWTQVASYPSCATGGSGSMWCPSSGLYQSRPGPGRYKTRAFAEVQNTAGGYGSTWVESGSVVLN